MMDVESTRRRRVREQSAVAACLAGLLVLTGCGGADDDFSDSATQAVAEESSARDFDTAGELAATSAHVVRGRVTAVERGPEIHYLDGSGAVITPRVLQVEVEEYLYSRNEEAATPPDLQISNGWWEDGEGYGFDQVAWAQPGDEVVAFLSRDLAPDGSVMSSYTPLGAEGLILLDEEKPDYDETEDSVWSYLGSSASTAELEDAVAESVDEARSGEAEPVLIDVCVPSVPGDEDSEPVCRKR